MTAAEELQCPVCLDTPPGEWHQCSNGHCFCQSCFTAIPSRLCPQCRDPLPPRNRNIHYERSVAALPTACTHCAQATTTSAEQVEHERLCPRRPIGCSNAALGCAWSGLLLDQLAHEAECPLVRLHAENQGLRAEIQRLRSSEGEAQRLCTEIQRLLARMSALEEGKADGRRRRRRQQSVGAAPQDVPPNLFGMCRAEEVERMGALEALGVVQVHLVCAPAVILGCKRLVSTCRDGGNRQLAAKAGVLEVVMAAMRAHPQVSSVQEWGCCTVHQVCSGLDGAGLERKERAAGAGVLEVAVAAMRAHPQAPGVQEMGCRAFYEVCSGTDAGLARKRRAAAAGVLEVAMAAMRAHPQASDVQEWGCRTVYEVCSGTDAMGLARKQRAEEAGIVPLISAALQAHPALGPRLRTCSWS